MHKCALNLNIKCPSGKLVSCTVELGSEATLGHTLYEAVEKQTGIPKTSQMLSYNSKLIHPNVILQKYGLTDGSCINLLIKGIGGGGTDTGSYVDQPNNDHFHYPNFYTESDEELLDECVSCGESAYIFCRDCKSSRCRTCDEQWHKHPKRRSHQTKVSQIYWYYNIH